MLLLHRQELSILNWKSWTLNHHGLIKDQSNYFSINSQQAAVEVDNIVIEEGGEFVKERIVLDKKRGISIYHTGDHCGRDAVTELVDSNFVSC